MARLHLVFSPMQQDCCKLRLPGMRTPGVGAVPQHAQHICFDSEKTGLTGSKRFSSDWLDSGGVTIVTPSLWLLER